MTAPVLDGEVLLQRLRALGDVGRDASGRLSRIALTEADRAGRDILVRWLEDAGLQVVIDAIGNIFGLWRTGDASLPPLMMGSHIDTVANAGIYDGCYGVLAGLGVIEALKRSGAPMDRPLIVAAFTNEEGARFAPDMMGSLVFAGGLPLEAALATTDSYGVTLRDALNRCGYSGSVAPGFVIPSAFLELHIEQGPVLEREGVGVGVVENFQGISWQKVCVTGKANHAGTTPMPLRRDAGRAAARLIEAIMAHVDQGPAGAVATVGTIAFHPNVVNVIPARAEFTLDLRHPDEETLKDLEADFARLADTIAEDSGCGVSLQSLARFEPFDFDPVLCAKIEAAATARGHSVRRMTSGAGHDAQMMARICPAAMIFVPSRDGVSHNPLEHTEPDQLIAGAQVLLDVVRRLTDPAATG